MSDEINPSETNSSREKDIFATFHETYDGEDMSRLKKAIQNLLSGKWSTMKAISLKGANCSKPFSFKNAYVDAVEHIDTLYPLGCIFLRGLMSLINFLTTRCVPTETEIKSLLEVLLTYLLEKDVHEALNYVGKYCKKETEVTVMIVNHLFLRITPNASCILDRGFTYNLDNECSDECEVKLKNTKSDDTTIGNPSVWHGRIDALLGPLPVALTRLPDDDDHDGLYMMGSCVEQKKHFVEIDLPCPQIISQAIVFSFLQNQRRFQQKKSLIPTIGVSSTELVVYFYDSENDVLLQSAPFFFNQGADNRIMAILVAWLVVNYEHLCDGLIDILKNTVPKANFTNVCDKTALEIYKSDLMHRDVGMGEAVKVSPFKYAYSTVKIFPKTQEALDALSPL